MQELHMPVTREAAIVVVDVQNDFVDPDGALAKSGVRVEVYRSMVDSLSAFLRSARPYGVPIILIRHENRPDTMSPVWLQKRRQLGREQVPVCQPATWGAQVLEAIRSAAGDQAIEIVKHRHSAFAFTSLPAVLQALGVRCLVVTGLSTNVCVEATVRDAFTYGYMPVVPEDCTAASVPHLHQPSLETMHRYFATVTDSENIIRHWESQQRS